MPLFPMAAAAQIAGMSVGCALYVEFAFKTATMRVWEGDGPLARQSVDWRGMGSRTDGLGNPLQSIDGLEQAVNGSAPQLSLTLSGVDATVVAAARADADADEIEGRALSVFLGFHDETTGAIVPVDTLLPLWTGVMQRPSFTADGPTLRTITLPCETLFSQRSRAAFAFLSDRDQQRRFTSDAGCIFLPKLVDRDVAWPRH